MSPNKSCSFESLAGAAVSPVINDAKRSVLLLAIEAIERETG
jgi:hypothetical protein